MFNVTYSPYTPPEPPTLPSQPMPHKVYGDKPPFPRPSTKSPNSRRTDARTNEKVRSQAKRRKEEKPSSPDYGRDYYSPILRGRVKQDRKKPAKEAVLMSLDKQTFDDRVTRYWIRRIADRT